MKIRSVLATTGVAFLLLSALSTISLSAQDALYGDLQTLEVVGRFEINAPDADPVTDIRWASKDTVFVSFHKSGVVELELSEGLPPVDQVLPHAREAGIKFFASFATSDDRVVATQLGRLPIWADIDSSESVIERSSAPPVPAAIFDLDVRGDDVLILGSPGMRWWEEDEGGILWMGDLSKGLSDWEVIHKDERIAEKPFLMVQRAIARGSVRFLDEGGFLVAPGFIPGVYHFSATGKLKEQWTGEEIGTESPDDEWVGKRKVGAERFSKYLGSSRVIDEVLAFDTTPGVVIRRSRIDGGGWLLGILDIDHAWYEIPFENLGPQAKVCGDVDRDDRIVVVGGIREVYEEAQYKENEILVLKVPINFSADS